MNKDVIYIAPEDDITDIIAKLKSASQRIVAIVPPQPAGVLRSAVNIKLIVKTAEESNKVPVLVTSDPALLKLAAATHLPVAESLQSRPSVPTESDLEELASTPEKEAKIAEDFVRPPRSVDEIIDSDDVENEISSDDEEENDDPEDEDSDDEEKNNNRKSSKLKKSEKSPSKFAKKFPWIAKNKKILIISGIALVLVAIFCVWAFVFAPSVAISLSIHTSSNNFSESATFTTKASEEDSAAGKFYLQEETFESESKVEFTATGKKDIGDKAKGSINISVYFTSEGSIKIPANTTFTYGGLNYLATSDATVDWDGEKICENGDSIQVFRSEGCRQTGTVEVSAAEPGSNYNIDSGKRDWSVSLNYGTGIKNITAENAEAISGGTSKIVTVVQQSDVDAAREKFTTASESDGKSQLFDKISKNVLVLENTYKSSISDPVVSPKVDEEVGEGVTPTISSKATFSVYTVDLVRVEEFITAKATLGSDQKIYSVGEPFVEYFNGSDDSYTGKLKTTFKSGPSFTEVDVLSKVSGRKIGEAQSILKSINGVESVAITPSFFWVNNIPSDPNKISIDIQVGE